MVKHSVGTGTRDDRGTPTARGPAWWVGLDREAFYEHLHDEEKRIADEKKFGQLIGNGTYHPTGMR